MNNVTYATVLTVGREADISLPDTEDTVSRRHLEIIIVDDGYYLRDLESQNGTYLEQKGHMTPFTQGWVSKDQVIALGETRLTLAELLGDSRRKLPGARHETEDHYIERSGVEPVKENPNYSHVSGKRVRCPNGHITLSTLDVCHRCGESLK